MWRRVRSDSRSSTDDRDLMMRSLGGIRKWMVMEAAAGSGEDLLEDTTETVGVHLPTMGAIEVDTIITPNRRITKD